MRSGMTILRLEMARSTSFPTKIESFAFDESSSTIAEVSSMALSICSP
jgi:hypothetical protein